MRTEYIHTKYQDLLNPDKVLVKAAFDLLAQRTDLTKPISPTFLKSEASS